jgi:hypothetical protein
MADRDGHANRPGLLQSLRLLAEHSQLWTKRSNEDDRFILKTMSPEIRSDHSDLYRSYPGFFPRYYDRVSDSPELFKSSQPIRSDWIISVNFDRN